MFRTRLALALLAVVALTVGACTASQTGSSPQASAQAPTPAAATPEPPATSEEPTESAGDDSGSGDYPLVAAEGDVGPYLTGEGGMTLYTFTNDTQNAGKSVCNDDCAANWPPYVLEGDDELTPGDGVTGTVTMITRDDGTEMVAYNGWPLYYYAADKAPGDTTGHEKGGVWFVAAP
jgi:predicted lipoprotein with Yx(FWY)xxD motif